MKIVSAFRLEIWVFNKKGGLKVVSRDGYFNSMIFCVSLEILGFKFLNINAVLVTCILFYFIIVFRTKTSGLQFSFAENAATFFLLHKT